MNPIIPTYVTYLIASILLVVWVARTLSRNGERFLLEVFADVDRARSVNQLLLVGFYLVSVGFIGLTMRIGGDVPDARAALETLAVKLGGVSLALGLLHILNLLVLSRVRRRVLHPAPVRYAAPAQPAYPSYPGYAAPAGYDYPAAPAAGPTAQPGATPSNAPA